jgi:anionic cell wall polymer biosynthesis LytR-Cps2A-Psr (LCP) family protein
VWPGEEKKEKKKRMPQIINIAGKTIAVSSIPEDTYTFIGDKPYTKKEFFIAIQSKRLSKEEISQGGKMATQLQNKRR